MIDFERQGLAQGRPFAFAQCFVNYFYLSLFGVGQTLSYLSGIIKTKTPTK